jgi:hypothetical protein
VSVEAITWALRQPISQSSAKFVLVVLANCASADSGLAWPSVAYLSSATGQDRKTVVANLARLQEWGLIEDTGKRAGTTKQIVMYRLICGPDLFVSEEKRNGSENGTVPKKEQSRNVGKGSRFSAEESQKRDTEPSLTNKNPNSSAQRSASRFDEFYQAYPKRVGRKRALEAWQIQGLEDLAEKLISDVKRRALEDGRWLEGFVPDPVTYLEEERWTDEIQPRRTAGDVASTVAPPTSAGDQRNPRATPEAAKLASQLDYLRQQHRYGAFGDGPDADAELDRLIAAARAEHEPQTQGEAA